jgi:hypothetical protein
MSTAWRTLANRHNLIFIPDQFPHKREHVVGEYQGYHLQLSHWTFGIEIILSSNQKEFSPEDEFPIGQPFPTDLLNSALLDPHLFAKVHGNIRAENNGQKIFYHQTGIFDDNEDELSRLQNLFRLLSNSANDYRKFLRLGGEAFARIQGQGKKLNPFARQLLRNIGDETTHRLSDRAAFLLCSKCLVRCRRYEVDLLDSLENEVITYYGCRYCQQSHAFIECQRVIAVLDEKMESEQFLQAGVLRVNWLIRRNLFDFDSIEIIQATDEDVERFAVQAGNNTEPIQTLTYHQISCLIAPDCSLSENTRRILSRMFRRIEPQDSS